MPKAKITLIKGDKVDPNTDYRDALPVNMYAVERPILGADGYMLCYPGLTSFATGNGVDRGGLYNERFGVQYRVSGDELVQVNTNGTVTTLGTISGTKQAAMPYSFNTQAVITNGKMWLYSPTSGFNEVTDPDLGDPIDGVWIDGYYFMTDGEFIFHTDIGDETAIDPLKFATAEFMPDKSLGVAKTQDDKVIVFGRYSLEYFVNQATSNFAFQRVENRAQKIGIVATHAKCEMGGNFYIVGGRKDESLGVYAVGVGQSVKISTREIDKLLAKYSEPDLADIRVESRNEDNTSFIIIHLPQEVLCFNASIASKLGKESSWSILKTGSEDEIYRGINGAYDSRLGYWVYGDKKSANIGKLDNTVFTQYGEKQEWYLYTPLVNMESMSIDEIEIETLPGNNSYLPDLSNDAKLAFSLTYDGRVWSSEWWDLYGIPGDYNKRYIQRRLGDVDDWVGFRFRGLTTTRMAFAGISLTYG